MLAVANGVFATAGKRRCVMELSQSELERRTLALCWREPEKHAHEVMPEVIYDPGLREALNYIQTLADSNEWPENNDSKILNLLSEIQEENIPVDSASLAECMKKVQARRFPLEALPEPMRSFVADVARVHRLPPELPGAMALAVASASLGKGVFLNNPPHKTPPNLFFLTTARSGTGKSECYRSVTQPLYQLEVELIEAFADTAADLEAEQQLLETEARSLRSEKSKLSLRDRQQRLKEINLRLKQIILESAAPRLIAEDATGPKLAAML